ncbi:hypothetical protein [Streptomyces sp. NPDC006645]
MPRTALLEPPYTAQADALLARMTPGGPADECWTSERERLLVLTTGTGR